MASRSRDEEDPTSSVPQPQSQSQSLGRTRKTGLFTVATGFDGSDLLPKGFSESEAAHLHTKGSGIPMKAPEEIETLLNEITAREHEEDGKLPNGKGPEVSGTHEVSLDHCPSYAFPSLPSSYIRQLGLPKASEETSISGSPAVSGCLTELEIESHFTELSLAFATDRLTLESRLEIQLRQRDLAEANMEQQIQDLVTNLQRVLSLCTNSESIELVSKIQQKVEIVKQSASRISSTAESYGQVEQEKRVSGVIDIMIAHVENLKRRFQREHTELEETKRILDENNIILEGDSFKEDGLMGRHPKYRALSIATNAFRMGLKSPKTRSTSVNLGSSGTVIPAGTTLDGTEAEGRRSAVVEDASGAAGAAPGEEASPPRKTVHSSFREGDEVGVESSQGAEKAESPSASASPGAAGPGAVPHPHLANASVPASHPPSGDLQRHGSDRPGGHWRHRVKKWCEEVYQCWPWNGQETLERIRIVIIVSFLFTALLIIINLFLSFLLPPTSDALSSCFPSSRGIPVSLQKLIEGGALLVYPGRPPPT